MSYKRKSNASHYSWNTPSLKKTLGVLSQGVKVALDSAKEESTRTVRHTKRTTEVGQSHGPSDPEFSTSSYVKLVKGPQLAKTRPFPTNTILDYSSGVIAGEAGRLHVNEIINPTLSALRSMLQKLYNQNPASFRPLIGTAPNLSGIYDQDIRVYFMSVEVLLDITNFSNAGCHVQIYDTHPKRNTQFAARQAWFEGLKNQGHDATLTTSSFTTPITQDKMLPGSHPNESEEFKQLWEIDFQRKIFLGPGDTHRHRQLYAPHKLLHASALNLADDGTAQNFMAGYSRSIIIAGHGAPCKVPLPAAAIPEVVGAGTEVQLVTTAPVDLGLLATVKFRYSMIENSVGGDIDIVGSLMSNIATGRIREADGDEVVVDGI